MSQESIPEPMVLLARLGAPHGVRGSIKASQIGEHLRSFVGGRLTIVRPRNGQQSIQVDYTIETELKLLHCAGGTLAFESIKSREQAAALTHAFAAAPLAVLRSLVNTERNNAPALLRDLWYFEIIDLAVIDGESQSSIGRIAAVEDLGLNTVVQIFAEKGQSLLTRSIEVPLEYPHWRTPDLVNRSVLLDEWRGFVEEN